MSLQSFHSHALGLPLFVLLSIVPLLQRVQTASFKHSSLIDVAPIPIFLTTLATISTINYSHVTSLFSIFFVSLYLLLFFYRGNDHYHHSIITKAFQSVLIIHVAFFYCQFFYWALTGVVLDPVNSLGMGFAEKWSSSKGFFINGGLVPRFMGLYNEPGTYSTWVFGLSIPVFLQSNNNLLKLLTIGSLVASASLYGFIFACVLLVYTFVYEYKIKARFICLLGFILLIIFSGVKDLINDSIIQRLFITQEGFHFRMLAIENALNNFACGNLCNQSAESAPLDIGLIFSVLSDGGIFLLLFFIFTIYFLTGTKNFGVLFLISVLVMTKMKLTYPLFWVIILYVYIYQRGPLRIFRNPEVYRNE